MSLDAAVIHKPKLDRALRFTSVTRCSIRLEVVNFNYIILRNSNKRSAYDMTVLFPPGSRSFPLVRSIHPLRPGPLFKESSGE